MSQGQTEKREQRVKLGQRSQSYLPAFLCTSIKSVNLTYNSVIKTDGHFSLTKQSQCFPTRLEKSSLFFSQQAWTRRWRMSHPYTVTHLLDSKKVLLLKAKRLEKVSLTLLYLIKALHSLCLQIRPPVSPVLWPQSTIWHSVSLLSCYFFPWTHFFPFSPPPLVLTA